MRLLIASAAVALLLGLWLPSRGASRGRAERTAATAVPAAESEAPAPAAATEEDERGHGGEEEEAGERAYRLTVVSRSDGSPVAGATVFDEDEGPRAVTGADGVAEFHGVARRWSAEAPGFFPDSVDFDPDGSGWVALAPAAAVTGLVLDEATRDPIAGARVIVWADDPDLGGDDAITDERGRFEASGALWQPFTLAATAEGYVPASVEGIVRGPVHGVEIRLAAGGTLEGVVRGRDGAPMRTYIYLKAGGEALPRRKIRTDAEGSYRATGVPLGIEVVPWSTDGCHGDPVTFREPGEVQRRDLRPRATATLTVTASGPVGREAALSNVGLEPGADRDQSRDGWVFHVPPGRYRIRACADGWPDQTREIEVESDVQVDIPFRDGLAVEGRVVASDGTAVRARVDWWDGSVSAGANTDGEGRFRMDGLAAGPGTLAADPWDQARKVMEGVLPGGPPVLIVVEPAARITGRIVGLSRCDDLNACVYTERRSGECGRLKDDGTFELLIQDLGSPVLLVLREPGTEAPVAIDLPALSSGEVRDVGEIRFGCRSVRGRIVGPDKVTVVGALVTVVEPWATQSTPRHSRSDDSGRFCLLRQPKSPIWLRVDAKGHPPHFFRVEADDAELRLSAPGVAQGPGKALLVADGPNDWAENTSLEAPPGAAGRFEARLQPGPYHGWTDVSGEDRELVPFVVREGETTQVELKPR